MAHHLPLLPTYRMIRLIDQFTMDPVVGPLVSREEQCRVERSGLSKLNSGGSGLPEVHSTLPWQVQSHKGGLSSFGVINM